MRRGLLIITPLHKSLTNASRTCAPSPVYHIRLSPFWISLHTQQVNTSFSFHGQKVSVVFHTPQESFISL